MDVDQGATRRLLPGRTVIVRSCHVGEWVELVAHIFKAVSGTGSRAKDPLAVHSLPQRMR